MPARKPKKPHPADVDTAEAIAQATEFSVLMHRYRARITDYGFPTLAAADARAQELEKENPGRMSLIYAIVSGRAHPVPHAMRVAVRGKGPTQ